MSGVRFGKGSTPATILDGHIETRGVRWPGRNVEQSGRRRLKTASWYAGAMDGCRGGAAG